MKKYTIENEYISLSFLDYGAIITSLYFKEHKLETVLSFDDLNDYLENDMHLGVSCVGPYAGRIENARYTINNEKYLLDKNFKNHSIHGGYNNFSTSFFKVNITDNCASLKLDYSFLKIEIIYTLNKDSFKQEIFATTQKPTLFNPTNHSYFNLDSNDCLDYVISLDSDYMYYLNEDSIPKEKFSIKETSFSILNGNGKIKEIYDNQFKITKGIDHPFHLNSSKIKITNPKNNFTLNIETNQEYAVVYTGNYIGDCKKSINKKSPIDYMGVCIETQNIPNGINNKDENSSILYPDDKYYYFNNYYITNPTKD